METLTYTEPKQAYREAPSRKLRKRHITDTSIALLDAIYRYRILPTSLLFRLVPGDHRNLYFHLQLLREEGYINHLNLLNGYGYRDENIYFIDHPKALALLAEHGIRTADELAVEVDRLSHGSHEPNESKLLFVRHELMIARFHAMLELACAASDGEVVLYEFRQGAALHHSVIAPGLGTKAELIRREKQLMLFESGEQEKIPHRPDAYATLYFPNREEGKQYATFLYEADRKTTDTRRMIQKLRGHFQFIVKQKLHQKLYKVPSIRAVLIETLDRNWAETLRQAASHPAVSGAKPSNLFWFTSSEFFTQPIAASDPKHKTVPLFLERPQVIFDDLWFSPNDRRGNSPRSILDP